MSNIKEKRRNIIIMEKFSEILKDFVLESGKSLRQIEKESGVASSQISRYLKNTIPSLEIAIKLSQYFNCTLDYLFGLSNIQGQASTGQFNLQDLLINMKNYLMIII